MDTEFEGREGYFATQVEERKISRVKIIGTWKAKS